MIFGPKNPDYRFTRVHREVQLSGAYSGDDALEEALSRLLRRDLDVPESVIRALTLHSVPLHRDAVNALLLVGARPKEIQTILGIPKEDTLVYEHLCFDTRVFRNWLEREAWAKDHGTPLMLQGLREGPEIVKVRLGGGRYAVSPSTFLHVQLNKAFEMLSALDASDSTIDLGSEKVKAVQKWALSGTKAVSQLPTAVDMSTADRPDDILFKIEKRKAEVATNDIDAAPTEILTGLEGE